MRITLLFLLVLILTACASISTKSPAPTNEVQPLAAAPLPDLGAAPELTNEIWLNVDKPLRLADLRGQVVLLEMWTFG